MKTKSTPASSLAPSFAARPQAGSGHGDGAATVLTMPQILLAMLAFRSGDFTQRLPAQWTGVEGKIADAFNDILAISNRRAKEAARVCRVVGKEGRLQQRMSVPGVTGGWADEIQSINTLIADLASPTTAVTRTIGAVAKGDVKALEPRIDRSTHS